MSKLHTYLEALKKRPQPEYDPEIIADALELLKDYGSPKSIKEIMISRNMEGFSADDIMEVLLALIPELKKGAGLSGGGYAYYPNQTLNVWKTSDGGTVRGKILDIMLKYMFQDPDEAAEMLTMESDYAMEEMLIKGRKDQADYEGSKMRGDKWYEDYSEAKKPNVKAKDKSQKISIVQILQQNGFVREDYERKSGGRSYWLRYQKSQSHNVTKKAVKDILTKYKIKFRVGKYSPEEIYANDESFEIHVQRNGMIYIIVFFNNTYASLMREGIDAPEQYLV